MSGKSLRSISGTGALPAGALPGPGRTCAARPAGGPAGYLRRGFRPLTPSPPPECTRTSLHALPGGRSTRGQCGARRGRGLVLSLSPLREATQVPVVQSAPAASRAFCRAIRQAGRHVGTSTAMLNARRRPIVAVTCRVTCRDVPVTNRAPRHGTGRRPQTPGEHFDTGDSDLLRGKQNEALAPRGLEGGGVVIQYYGPRVDLRGMAEV